MPVYEYLCLECGEKTEVRASVAEKEKGLNVVCQKCGSKKLVQVFGNIWIGTSSKGSKSTTVRGCGPQATPGCCG